MHEVYPPDVVLLLYDITDPNSLTWVADIFIVNTKRNSFFKHEETKLIDFFFQLKEYL
jgi:hypothetical protein